MKELGSGTLGPDAGGGSGGRRICVAPRARPAPRSGIEHPDVNERRVVGATPYHPDLRWAAPRLILEVDSAWHDGPVAQEDDGARQAGLEAAGERVLRTTLEQAILRPRQLVQRLVAAGAPYTDRQR
jgi:hypothetical protein